MPALSELKKKWFVDVNDQEAFPPQARHPGSNLMPFTDGNQVELLVEGATVMGDFHYYRPQHTIQDIARKAREIVTLTHQYGEGWLIAGEIGEFVKGGVENVLCLQPFGCIANQVVVKGVAKRLKEKYPRLNLLCLDLDAGISEVNFLNRLHFFINHAKRSVAGSSP